MLSQQSPKISLQEHPELITLLQDESFRRELESRPVEVLEKYDVHLSSKEIPRNVKIPTELGIQALRVGGEIQWLGLI